MLLPAARAADSCDGFIEKLEKLDEELELHAWDTTRNEEYQFSKNKVSSLLENITKDIKTLESKGAEKLKRVQEGLRMIVERRSELLNVIISGFKQERGHHKQTHFKHKRKSERKRKRDLKNTQETFENDIVTFMTDMVIELQAHSIDNDILRGYSAAIMKVPSDTTTLESDLRKHHNLRDKDIPRILEAVKEGKNFMILKGRGPAQVCEVCGLDKKPDGSKLQHCSKCMKVLYCGRECQKKDRKKHKQQCKLLGELQLEISARRKNVKDRVRIWPIGTESDDIKTFFRKSMQQVKKTTKLSHLPDQTPDEGDSQGGNDDIED